MKILTNARIQTLDPSLPQATTLVIYGDRIRAVGGDELLASFNFVPPEDMQGYIILPGLIDAHLHLQEYALSRTYLDCRVKSRQALLSKVGEISQGIPDGQWVRGHGWDQNVWDGSYPTAAELDAVTAGKPAYLTAKSLHAACVNSMALRLAGISSSTPDPPGGRLLRNEGGSPTGILLDTAMELVEKVIPEPAPEVLVDLIQDALPMLWAVGLTGVHDFDGRTCFLALQMIHARGNLKFRVQKSIPGILLQQFAESGLRTGFGDDFLWVGPVKMFADGALGSHTAALSLPYVDDPQNRGILIMDSEQVFEQGRLAVKSGISLAVHAIGDRAVHEVLDGFSRLRKFERENGLPSLRHRIEHVQTIAPEDSGRLAELGVFASMQPTHAVSDMDMADKLLGARAGFSYAWRTLADAGTHMIFGSDAPVENPNPFEGISAAVSRRRLDGYPGRAGWHPEQRLSIREAIEGFTLGPAFSSGRETRLGRLSPGFLADLMVLDEDPFTNDTENLSGMHPLATMIGGEWVWGSLR